MKISLKSIGLCPLCWLKSVQNGTKVFRNPTVKKDKSDDLRLDTAITSIQQEQDEAVKSFTEAENQRL